MPEDVTLQVVGCGDAFGSGGRFQTCFLLRDGHGTMAIDFGATSLVGMRAAGLDPHAVDHVVLSHFHGDHMGGLPFLLLDREFNSQPPAPLTVIGPPGLPERLRTLTECLFPGAWRDPWRFALTLIELAPDRPAEIGGRRLLSTPVNHPTGAFTATALRIETGGKAISYSGDTGWVDGLRDIATGSDLFICECFERWEQPYVGHLSLPVLLEKLPDLEARRILLTHLGPEMMAAPVSMPFETMTDGAIYRI